MWICKAPGVQEWEHKDSLRCPLSQVCTQNSMGALQGVRGNEPRVPCREGLPLLPGLKGPCAAPSEGVMCFCAPCTVPGMNLSPWGTCSIPPKCAKQRHSSLCFLSCLCCVPLKPHPKGTSWVMSSPFYRRGSAVLSCPSVAAFQTRAAHTSPLQGFPLYLLLQWGN